MVPKIRDALFLFRKKFKRKKCEFFEMSGITEKTNTNIVHTIRIELFSGWEIL